MRATTFNRRLITQQPKKVTELTSISSTEHAQLNKTTENLQQTIAYSKSHQSIQYKRLHLLTVNLPLTLTVMLHLLHVLLMMLHLFHLQLMLTLHLLYPLTLHLQLLLHQLDQ